MNPKKIFQSLLVNTSIYFTLITVVYVAIVWLVNVEDDTFLVSVDRLLLNFVFSALAAGAWTLSRLPRIRGAARLLLHYGILTLSFYLCFLLYAGMNGAQVLIGLAIFTVCYFAVWGISTLFLSRFRANAEQEAPYAEQYKKKR